MNEKICLALLGTGQRKGYAMGEDADGAFGYRTYVGTGGAMTVYVDASLASPFFKVIAE